MRDRLIRLYDWIYFKVGILISPLSDTVAIRRGVRLLDRRRPGWAGEVDPDLLNLNSATLCVLGQIYGNYSEGLRQLSLEPWFDSRYRWRNAYWHGFIHNSYSRVPRQRSDRWRKIIVRRRPTETFLRGRA